MPRAASVAGSAQDVGRVGGATEGQDARVLEEEEPVADPTVGALGHEALLERQRLAVVDPPEPRRDDRPRVGGRPAPARGPVSRSPRPQRSRTGSSGRPTGPSQAPAPARASRSPRGCRARRSAPRRTRPPAAASSSRATPRHGSTSRRPRGDQDQAPRDRVEGRRLFRVDQADRPQGGQREEPRTNSGTARRTPVADRAGPRTARPRPPAAVAPVGRLAQTVAIRNSSGAISALRMSLTTVATSSASGPYAALVAMTWLVSWTATPPTGRTTAGRARARGRSSGRGRPPGSRTA